MDEAKHRAAEAAHWRTIGVEPDECWVDVDGRRVRVQVVGDGPPVLFVHGATNSGTSWAPLAARLDRYRCLLLDRPGCGLSEVGPPAVDVGDFVRGTASLCAAVLDGLGIERAHLVGTSLGGAHVLRTAAAHPERVGRVVVLGWTVGAAGSSPPLVMRMAGFRRLGRALAGLPKPDRAIRSMLRQIGLRDALAAGRMSGEAVAWYASLLNDTPSMRNDIDASPAVLHPFRGFNPEVLFDDATLAAVEAPVRLVWGESDPFGGPDAARAFAARVPGADLQLVPGGHAVWLDDADGAADLVGSFLDGAAW